MSKLIARLGAHRSLVAFAEGAGSVLDFTGMMSRPEPARPWSALDAWLLVGTLLGSSMAATHSEQHRSQTAKSCAICARSAKH